MNLKDTLPINDGCILLYLHWIINLNQNKTIIYIPFIPEMVERIYIENRKLIFRTWKNSDSDCVSMRVNISTMEKSFFNEREEECKENNISRQNMNCIISSYNDFIKFCVHFVLINKHFDDIECYGRQNSKYAFERISADFSIHDLELLAITQTLNIENIEYNNIRIYIGNIYINRKKYSDPEMARLVCAIRSDLRSGRNENRRYYQSLFPHMPLTEIDRCIDRARRALGIPPPTRGRPPKKRVAPHPSHS